MTSSGPGRLARVSWPGVGSAVLTSCMVGAPLALGLSTGHAAAGATGAFGGYLFAVSHLTSVRPLGPKVSGTTVLLLGLAAGVGAAAGRHLWLLVMMAALWAGLQALADVAGGALRMPIAFSALCLLLSAIGGGTTPGGALWRGILVLAGATWMAVVDAARRPPWRSRQAGTRDVGIAALGRAWPRARGFSLLLAVPTALAAAVAGAFQISHGAWMATTVLRVLRPDSGDTIARGWRRTVGTAAGALAAAVLLAAVPHPVVALVVLVVAFTAMQLIGPRRYGVYTFFLTVIALELGSVSTVPDWGVALVRVLLTVVGTAIAVCSGLVYDRLRRRRAPPAPPAGATPPR